MPTFNCNVTFTVCYNYVYLFVYSYRQFLRNIRWFSTKAAWKWNRRRERSTKTAFSYWLAKLLGVNDRRMRTATTEKTGSCDLPNCFLSCWRINAGTPSPRVTWWREGRLLDSTSESVTPGRVRNTLRIPNLSRADQGMTLTCQASNNNVSVPTSAATTVEMKRKLILEIPKLLH